MTKAQSVDFSWSELAAIPDPYGFAGSFAGISGGSLLVAGGANFPDGGAPWTGSTKVWSDQVFVLEKPDGQWKLAGKLPLTLGYGVSASWNNQLICAGGSNGKGHSKKVFAIAYANGKLKTDTLPDLPYTLANCSGAIAGNILYIAGGITDPDARHCSTAFLSLDLSKPLSDQHWKQLESWPGPARMLAVAGSMGNTFYLFSGAELIDAGNGSVKRRYLRDAYGYTAGRGWKQLAQMPAPGVAAPSPAYASKGLLRIFGGDTGELAERSDLKDAHPGFSREILAYDAGADTWKSHPDIPVRLMEDSKKNPNGSIWAPVTVSLVVWNGKIVFPGGEVRPAVRTPRVRIASPENQ